VTVVTVGQVDANLGSGLHLELVHSLTSLGNIDLVVALHSDSLLLLSSAENTFRRKRFSFRSTIFTRTENNMNVSCRKNTKILEKVYEKLTISKYKRELFLSTFGK
jgi:hypothetical protein